LCLFLEAALLTSAYGLAHLRTLTKLNRTQYGD
jgi:hypothetical protein